MVYPLADVFPALNPAFSGPLKNTSVTLLFSSHSGHASPHEVWIRCDDALNPESFGSHKKRFLTPYHSAGGLLYCEVITLTTGQGPVVGKSSYNNETGNMPILPKLFIDPSAA